MIALRVLAFTLCAVLVYVLYLPSTRPPERFVQQVRVEHARNAAFWGEDEARAILERALALYAHHDALAGAAVAPTPGVPVTAVNAAVASEMAGVVQRLLDNSYTRAFDAVVLLAAYRWSALVQWLPWVVAFVALACFDGCMVRVIRSKEFLEHSPMRFALCAVAATLALALLLVILVVPLTISPLLLGCVPLAFGTFVARAISHFHR